MTAQDSLDEIQQLLLAYPGMESAVVIRVPNQYEVWIRFRCSDVSSIRDIASEAVWANVAITLGNPDERLGAEPAGVTGLPCDIEIPDTQSDSPTHAERLGVYISERLAERGHITKDKRDTLHARWNTRLARTKRKSPSA